jgi:hypothetical protein
MLGGALVVGSVLSYALWPQSERSEQRGVSDPPAVGQSSLNVPAAASPSSSAVIFKKIPDSCKLISEATLSLLIPKPKLRPHGASTSKGCEIDGGVYATKFLTVSMRLVYSATDADPIEGGKWSFGLDVEALRELHKSDLLVNLADLGDQAFYHRGLRTNGKDVQAGIEVRVANVIVILSYLVTDTNLAKTEQVQRELTGAMREALASLGKPLIRVSASAEAEPP